MPQQSERSVDRRRHEFPTVETVDCARLLQVRHEVLDVGRPNLRDSTIAEALDQRLESVIDRARKGQALREDVSLLVRLREFPNVTGELCLGGSRPRPSNVPVLTQLAQDDVLR